MPNFGNQEDLNPNSDFAVCHLGNCVCALVSNKGTVTTTSQKCCESSVEILGNRLKYGDWPMGRVWKQRLLDA